MAGWCGQGMRVKGVLGKPSRHHSPQAGTWAWGSKKGGQVGARCGGEGCQVVLVARTCCSSSSSRDPAARPFPSHRLASACLWPHRPLPVLVYQSDAATADQNPLPSGVRLKEKWFLQPGGQSRRGGLRVPGRAPSWSWWPGVGSVLLRLVCGQQWPSAISLLTLNSLSAKEASRAASHHLGSTVSFGSRVLPTGLRGVGAALPGP